ncbi:uncharacterized protein N7446_005546 [Penicillium canescens]|uniref:Translationally-controlled tumor protein homolog n=1 Tax=Penicillium canescens TaxID=5083 RepID=A0AAD6NBT4_PENCN|nr:uncharacterized protein N7446_005546 [Penicillium canescens]KAJ6050217.1 hypothetical protein N7444_006933 [Penicillium canescens]KAJ6050921.1 hypothetical protein N7460_001455 [Penicillium canescens]KAJ6061426.1 hypothetical protein N7446_005546 [Penicillium canescens]
MIVYEDIISGDEMITDKFDLKEVDGVAYEADCHYIEVKAGYDVDHGASGDSDNDQEETETVLDIIYSQRLQPTSFDKESYRHYLGGYINEVKSKTHFTDQERLDFKTKADALTKKIVSNFKDYVFYTGESQNSEGMVVLLSYREDGVTPYLTLWKHGLKGREV